MIYHLIETHNAMIDSITYLTLRGQSNTINQTQSIYECDFWGGGGGGIFLQTSL